MDSTPNSEQPVTPRKTFGKSITTTSSSEIAPSSPITKRKDLTDYIKIDNLTPQQIQQLKKGSRRINRGVTARAAMKCHGTACPFLSYCDLHAAGVPLPVGDQCPIEELMVDRWRQDFFESLMLNPLDSNTYLITQIIDDLVLDLIIQTRVLMSMGEEPDVMVEETVGINQFGDPITNKKLYPGFALLQSCSDKKLKRLRELLATPRAKAEAGRLGVADPSTQAAAAQAKANQLKKLVHGSERKVVDLGDGS